MKNIDIKSLIIGALFTSTVLLGIGATGPKDTWDNKQQWDVTVADQTDIAIARRNPERTKGQPGTGGWEPIGTAGANIIFRKRIK